MNHFTRGVLDALEKNPRLSLDAFLPALTRDEALELEAIVSLAMPSYYHFHHPWRRRLFWTTVPLTILLILILGILGGIAATVIRLCDLGDRALDGFERWCMKTTSCGQPDPDPEWVDLGDIDWDS
jgi:hypothetical protein